jgi:hypothetical protein
MTLGLHQPANHYTVSSLRVALKADSSTNTTSGVEMSVTTHDAGKRSDYHNGDSTWRLV